MLRAGQEFQKRLPREFSRLEGGIDCPRGWVLRVGRWMPGTAGSCVWVVGCVGRLGVGCCVPGAVVCCVLVWYVLACVYVSIIIAEGKPHRNR